MHRVLSYAAYGSLALGGIMHFIIDVVSHHLRSKRIPGPETTLYYGINTAYALGLVLFGLVGLLLIRKAPGLLVQWPMMTLSLAASAGWMAICLLFFDYKEPRAGVVIFASLVLASFFTRPSWSKEPQVRV
ncbi:MAG: hypothetical protein EOP85_15430 [Verrucomicrobiaceae bacterium]|nr:MAG: hypothetical protein EOP85_15430 [Verrucomicrobiaceae bacterium]